MKLNIKRKVALATAAGCLLAMSSATALAQGHGNSAFGHSQGSSLTRTKGSMNNAFGAMHSAGRGNSAFGHSQGSSLTRTKGSMNNAFGRGHH
jgi:hypothetical protein